VRFFLSRQSNKYFIPPIYAGVDPTSFQLNKYFIHFISNLYCSLIVINYNIYRYTVILTNKKEIVIMSSLLPVNHGTQATPVNTATQAGKKGAAAAAAGTTTSTITDAPKGKGLIATILSPITCAAKAIASFVVAAFKKVFCCFYGDSKEVKGLKALQTALNDIVEGKAGADKKKEVAYNTKAVALIADLPQAVKDEMIARAKQMILAVNDKEADADARAANMVNRLVDYAMVTGSEVTVPVNAPQFVLQLVTQKLEQDAK
jgi:hypothetical protein